MTRIAPMALTKVTMPEPKALRPKPICIISGSRKGVAPTPIRTRKPEAIAARNAGVENSRRSSTGSGRASACRT